MSEQKLESLTNKIMVEFAKTIEMFDLTPLEARLFAYLYLEEKALTLDDMSDALGKSKTSMSTGIRSLLDMNLVTRVWKKGVRKDLYRANFHLFKSFMISYINKWIDAANHQKDSLDELNEKIMQLKEGLNNKDKLMTIEKRLNNIIEFHQLVEQSFREMKQE